MTLVPTPFIPVHRLAASGWDPIRGCLFVACSCGFEDAVFAPSPSWFDAALVAEEAEQLRRFQRHLAWEAR